MHCPSHEVGQDHAKNNHREWRSLSLKRHLGPGALHDARNGYSPKARQGEQAEATPIQGRGKSWGPWTGQANVEQGPWKTMLLAGIHKRVCTSGDARL